MNSDSITFTFGTGNIIVQPGFTAFKIYETDNAGKCGSVTTNAYDCKNYLISVSSMHEYNELRENIELVESNKIKKFVFKGYIFDFSIYNQASVDVMKWMLNELYQNSFGIWIAC